MSANTEASPQQQADKPAPGKPAPGKPAPGKPSPASPAAAFQAACAEFADALRAAVAESHERVQTDHKTRTEQAAEVYKRATSRATETYQQHAGPESAGDPGEYWKQLWALQADLQRELQGLSGAAFAAEEAKRFDDAARGAWTEYVRKLAELWGKLEPGQLDPASLAQAAQAMMMAAQIGSGYLRRPH